MGRTDRAEILAASRPEAVWAALTDPSHVGRWLAPDGMTARVEAWEARAGGRLRVVLTYRDAVGAPGKTTAESDAVTGRFVDAVAPARLVWVTAFDGAGSDLAGEMTMAWTLTPEGGGTRVAVTARNVPRGIAEADHTAGLNATLRQLARAAVTR